MASPSVSIILPTPASAPDAPAAQRRLRLVLASIEAQTAPAESYELLLVDNGAVDVTGLLPGRAGPPAVVVRPDRPGLAGAVNAGVTAAQSELLFLALDQTLLSPGALAAHLDLHRQRPGERVVACGRRLCLPHSALFRDVTESSVEPADVLAFGARPGGEWIYRALEMLELHLESLHEGDVTGDFRRIELLAACTDAGRDAEQALRAGTGAVARCRWLATRFGNLSAPRALLREVGGLDQALDAHEGWLADFDLGYRLWRAGAQFTLAESAATVELLTAVPADDLGRASAIAYLLGKHGAVEFALLPLYLTGTCGTLEQFSRYLEAAERHWQPCGAREPS